jgi:hypothetical protein
MRRAAVREVLAVVLSTSVGLWTIVQSHGALEVVAMIAFIFLFNGAWLTHFFTLRAGVFGPSGEGIEAFIDLTRRRLAARVSYAVPVPVGPLRPFREYTSACAAARRAIVTRNGEHDT